VHDNQRRDWWGNPVVPSWYAEASTVLDLDGTPRPLTRRTEAKEADVTIGADGFSYTRPEEAGATPRGFKLGSQV
jgi:catechol 2,3-dioxygenase